MRGLERRVMAAMEGRKAIDCPGHDQIAEVVILPRHLVPQQLVVDATKRPLAVMIDGVEKDPAPATRERTPYRHGIHSFSCPSQLMSNESPRVSTIRKEAFVEG
jgi:hypothetical protein